MVLGKTNAHSLHIREHETVVPPATVSNLSERAPGADSLICLQGEKRATCCLHWWPERDHRHRPPHSKTPFSHCGSHSRFPKPLDARIRKFDAPSLEMVINRLPVGGFGHRVLVSIFVSRVPKTAFIHTLCDPTPFPPVSPTHREHLSSHLLPKELEVAVMMACEGPIHAEDGYPLPSLWNPAVGWVRHIPLPTLVAYREKVFPGEIHHILPLEQPECWVTCDSIGLFLETECKFPLESEDDCDCYDREHGSGPAHRRQGFGPTKLLVKKASMELIDLYRRFLLPDLAGPKLRLVCSSENRDRWIIPSHFEAFLERLYDN